jgi:hypothetical protein
MMGKTSHEQALRPLFSRIVRTSGQTNACGMTDIVCCDPGGYNLHSNQLHPWNVS